MVIQKFYQGFIEDNVLKIYRILSSVKIKVKEILNFREIKLWNFFKLKLKINKLKMLS